MDKFFEKLFAKIAEFHQREAEFSQSLVDNTEELPTWMFDSTPKQEFYIKEFLKLNKENLPQA
tara:strand:- start:249 stop:437 length:189 start_codon:yes stop_codon:yes gene_type:complete